MSVPNNALKDRLRLAMDLKDMRAIELSEKTGIPNIFLVMPSLNEIGYT